MKKQKPKHRHRKERRKGGRLELVRHPFSGIDPDLLQLALFEIAEKQVTEFPLLVERIAALLRVKYPLHLLSVVAGYGLQAGVTDEGVETRFMPDIDQHHIELLQALLLTLPTAEWGGDPAAPGDVQSLIDTLRELAEAFYQRRFLAAKSELDLQARTVLTLQNMIRLHTQVVRNWGYFSQVIRISSELYAPLDENFIGPLGFTASNYIAVAEHLVELLEKRSRERFTWLRRVFREHNMRRIVRTYLKYCPDCKTTPEELLAAFPKNVSRQQVLATLLSHADLQFLSIMTFTPAELAARTGLCEEVVGRVLDALSLEPGGLQGQNPEHLFMSNPIWQKPILKLDKTYFCATPQSAFSHIHDIMRSLADKAGLKAELEVRRAKYLQSKVEDLLARALPGAELRHAIIWKTEASSYETDHLALIDRTAVIVEDKSGSLSASGLRGAPARVQRHVEDLILAPSEQSARLEAMIARAATGDADAKKNLEPFGLNFAGYERIIRISVTLDDFSVLASSEQELKEAGWIPEKTMLAPTVHVADMETVIDILETPAFFLHYFAERERVQKTLNLMADELDLLGCYLQTGFNLAGLEGEGYSLALTGMSAPMDRYYNAMDAGIVTKKPKPNLTPYFASLIDAIVRRGFPRWTTITTDLLRCANFDEQRKLDRHLAELKRMVERDWRNPKHTCCVIINPPKIRDTAVVFYAYPPQLAANRRETAEQLGLDALTSTKRDRCVMVCKNTDRWNEPYTSVLILSADGRGNRDEA